MIDEFGDKQRRLALWWSEDGYDGVIAEGAIRSGKTWAMIAGFMLWSQLRFSNQMFIIAGRTFGSLVRNVVTPMRYMLREMFRWPSYYNRGDGYLTVGTNTYWLFGASSEQAQDALQGMTAAGCLLDEVALFPKSFVEQAIGRCSVEGSKLWFNCNPSYPEHFIKTEYVDHAEDKHMLHLQFTMADNPSLSQSIIERYERMYTGVFYDRYVLGLWVAAEGLIYQNWKTAIEETPEFSPQDWCISCDYGTQNPFAAVKWLKDPNGTWHAVEEYYYSGREQGHQKTDQDYLDDMERFAEGLPDGKVEFIIDPSAMSFIVLLRRSGRFRVRKADNAVLDGIRETSSAMQSGIIKVSDSMERTKKEFAGYVWEDKQDSDRPVKENDHAMDAIRYFVKTKHVNRRTERYETVFSGRRGMISERRL